MKINFEYTTVSYFKQTGTEFYQLARKNLEILFLK